MQQGTKDLTPEEIDEKKKTAGLFEELNYAANGVKYELIGIESINGADYYVIKRENSKGESFDYFNMNGQKEKTVSIVTVGDETTEVTNTYGDYKDVEGIKFPHKTSMIMGEMGFNGEVKSIKVNQKIDGKVFLK